MGDIILRYIPLPLSVPAYTATDSNDDYNVYINSLLSYSAQEKAKNHELEHIHRNHFHTNKPVRQCEQEV